jgi:hypothetical protein
MMTFLSEIGVAATWCWDNREQIIAAFAAIIAGASVFVKSLQTFVDFLAHHFPALGRADNAFASVLRFLAWLSHIRFFNTIALNAKPSHAIQLGNSLPDTRLPMPNPVTAAVLPLALAFFLIPILPACAHMPPLVTTLVDCEEQGIQQQIPAVASQVASVLTGSSPNWQDALDALELSQGDAVGCAVSAFVNGLEHSAARGTIAETSLVRGEVWIRAQPKLYRSP